MARTPPPNPRNYDVTLTTPAQIPGDPATIATWFYMSRDIAVAKVTQLMILWPAADFREVTRGDGGATFELDMTGALFR